MECVNTPIWIFSWFFYSFHFYELTHIQIHIFYDARRTHNNSSTHERFIKISISHQKFLLQIGSLYKVSISFATIKWLFSRQWEIELWDWFLSSRRISDLISIVAVGIKPIVSNIKQMPCVNIFYTFPKHTAKTRWISFLRC